MDPILKELLRPSPSIVDLDKRPDAHNFDFCCRSRNSRKESMSAEPRGRCSLTRSLEHSHACHRHRRTDRPDGEEYPASGCRKASGFRYSMNSRRASRYLTLSVRRPEAGYSSPSGTVRPSVAMTMRVNVPGCA